MNNKKKEKPDKPRDAIYLRVKGKLREKLEEERERRGGDAAGVKFQPIIKERLMKSFDCDCTSKKK